MWCGCRRLDGSYRVNVARVRFAREQLRQHMGIEQIHQRGLGSSNWGMHHATLAASARGPEQLDAQRRIDLLRGLQLAGPAHLSGQAVVVLNIQHRQGRYASFGDDHRPLQRGTLAGCRITRKRSAGDGGNRQV